MDWSALQYQRFEVQRSLPIRDLLARVPTTEVHRAADLGCGPGNSTEALRERFPGAVVTGIDSSPDMIEAARKRLPEVQFRTCDIAGWEAADGSYDVVLANASMQWVPDHAALLPRLLRTLAPGGSLAVQMPDNLGEPAHLLMREIAERGPWAARLAGVGREHENRESAEWYYRTLCGVATVEVWRTTYYHALEGGARAVIEWFRGSALKTFLAPLNEDERESFLTMYEAAVAGAYPALRGGAILLPFPRLFFVATRSH